MGFCFRLKIKIDVSRNQAARTGKRSVLWGGIFQDVVGRE